jgi:hypothetical protein
MKYEVGHDSILDATGGTTPYAATRDYNVSMAAWRKNPWAGGCKNASMELALCTIETV